MADDAAGALDVQPGLYARVFLVLTRLAVIEAFHTCFGEATLAIA
jgi:hypothetical protein